MLRVPGSSQDLLSVKARGGDVRVVYSPLDAVKLAKARPDRKVVFFAVGFETTAPANAMAVHRAAREGVENFSVLVAHVLVPPALQALLSAPGCVIQGLLAPGHVCVVTGYRAYEDLAQRYHVPIVVTGFEPLDLLRGVLATVGQLERGEARVENEYPRAVRADGNLEAQRMIDDVFVVSDRAWRGVGVIPLSGYSLQARYERFDAVKLFEVEGIEAHEPEECLSGLVLQGRLKPTECPEFGTRCTPEHPKGATMVSSEGACAAYFHYGRVRRDGVAAAEPASRS
jgi:hydrogenase expression/formation protein HypD